MITIVSVDFQIFSRIGRISDFFFKKIFQIFSFFLVIFHTLFIFSSPLYGLRPILALASASEKEDSKFSNQHIQLYSLQKNAPINQMRFKSRVLSMKSSRRVFIVALRSHIYGFDAVRMDKVSIVYVEF